MVKRLPNELVDVVKDIIHKTTSDSNVAGNELREAHYQLGEMLGNYIEHEELNTNNKVLVIIKMRSGLMFGLGLADEIESKNHRVHIVFDTNSVIKNSIDTYDRIILVDGVINSGRSIVEDLNTLNNPKVLVATNVISSQAVDLFLNHIIYAVRQSEKHFVGTDKKIVSGNQGPDTSERLFRSDFFVE